MSNIIAGVKALGGRHISIGAMAKGAQKSIGYAEASGRQNGGVMNNEIDNASTVNVTGNTFEIKKEDDINSLANRIAALVNQQQRSLGSSILSRFASRK